MNKIVNYTLACLLITSCHPGDQNISEESSYQVSEATSSTDTLSIQVYPEKTNPKQIVAGLANNAILAIKNRDMKKLSGFVHPDKGVRFSPHCYVDLKNNIVITATRIKNILDDETRYTWGTYKGSGEPIELTFKEYFERFIYDQDFAGAEEIGFNKIIGKGNLQNNILEVYPRSTFVEYHFPGFEPKYEGMDWKSLYLVFEEKDSIWYLIAIIHNQWTI